MPVNKVVINTEDGAQTLIDLTGDTVTPETLSAGITAHDKSGNAIVGTMPTAGEIMGDTGFLSLSTTDITIGANTVSLGKDAIIYLNELAGGDICAIALLDNPTTQNQLIMIPGAMINPSHVNNTTSYYHDFKTMYRYRTDGTYQTHPMINDFALKLVEGTRYRVWLATVQTADLSPY